MKSVEDSANKNITTYHVSVAQLYLYTGILALTLAK